MAKLSASGWVTVSRWRLIDRLYAVQRSHWANKDGTVKVRVLYRCTFGGTYKVMDMIKGSESAIRAAIERLESHFRQLGADRLS